MVDAKSTLLDAIIKIRQALLLLPEVQAESVLSSAVQKSLSMAYFDKAYRAHLGGQPFPWVDFARSLRRGVEWRHVSLLVKIPSVSSLTRQPGVSVTVENSEACEVDINHDPHMKPFGCGDPW